MVEDCLPTWQKAPRVRDLWGFFILTIKHITVVACYSMDPRHLFADERLTDYCVFCGAAPKTRDHNPSRVLLDKPYPHNLPVVEACESCNRRYSRDEQYLACLIECAICGSPEPNDVQREKIKRILSRNPALTTRLRASQRRDEAGNLTWIPEIDRVRNVVLKLARGHVAYELSLPQLEDPDYISFVPFVTMTEDQRSEFELAAGSGPEGWPEIGSRAFIRAAKGESAYPSSGWIVVQPDRYRYRVAQADGNIVQMVVSEYLACHVIWR